MNSMKNKMVLIGFIVMIIYPSLTFGHDMEWTEKGYGRSKDEAIMNARISIINQAMGKAIGAKSKDPDINIWIKARLSTKENYYFREYMELYVREEGFAAKVYGRIDMDLIERDARRIIKRSSDERELPGIAIYMDDEIESSLGKKISGNLGEKFKDLGYNIVDLEMKRKDYLNKLFRKNINNRALDEMSNVEIKHDILVAGIDYFVYVPVADYRDKGKDKLTGEDIGSLTLEVKIVEVHTGQAKILANSQKTVLAAYFG